jgi:O-antigen/teichoic acid export membrane protein
VALSGRQVYVFGTGATVVGRVLELGCGFVIVWMLTRMLGVEGYGDFLIALSLAELVSMLGGGGLEAAVVYRTSRVEVPPGELDDGHFAAAALRAGALVAGIATATLWLAADAMAALLAEPGVAFWIRGLALLVPVQMIRTIYAAWHRGRQRIAQASLLGLGLPRLSSAVVLGIVFAVVPTPGGIVAATVLGPLLVLIPWFAHSPVALLQRRAAFDGWDRRYALKMSLNRGIARTLVQANVLLLGGLSSSAAAAHYGVASRVAQLTALVFGILIPVFNSRVGYLHGRDRVPELEREYDQTRTVALLGALLVAAIIGVLGRPVLALFGDFENALPILWILAATWVAQASLGMNRAYLGLAGYAGWTLSTSLLLLLINVGLNILLIPRWGGTGAALAFFLSVVGIRGLSGLIAWHLDRFRTWSLELAALTALAVGSLLAGAAGWIGPLLVGAGVMAPALWLVARHHRLWIRQAAELVADLRRPREAG